MTRTRESFLQDLLVTVTLTGSDDHVCLAVDDDGPGIPEAVQRRIYEPFFTTKDTGTGLGLSIVHGMVVLHGGTISVDSGPRGTRFDVKLPRRSDSGIVACHDGSPADLSYLVDPKADFANRSPPRRNSPCCMPRRCNDETTKHNLQTDIIKCDIRYHMIAMTWMSTVSTKLDVYNTQ